MGKNVVGLDYKLFQHFFNVQMTNIKINNIFQEKVEKNAIGAWKISCAEKTMRDGNDAGETCMSIIVLQIVHDSI